MIYNMINLTTITLIILAPTVAFLLIKYFYLKQDVDFALHQIRILLDITSENSADIHRFSSAVLPQLENNIKSAVKEKDNGNN